MIFIFTFFWGFIDQTADWIVKEAVIRSVDNEEVVASVVQSTMISVSHSLAEAQQNVSITDVKISKVSEEEVLLQT